MPLPTRCSTHFFVSHQTVTDWSSHLAPHTWEDVSTIIVSRILVCAISEHQVISAMPLSLLPIALLMSASYTRGTCTLLQLPASTLLPGNTNLTLEIRDMHVQQTTCIPSPSWTTHILLEICWKRSFHSSCFARWASLRGLWPTLITQIQRAVAEPVQLQPAQCHVCPIWRALSHLHRCPRKRQRDFSFTRALHVHAAWTRPLLTTNLRDSIHLFCLRCLQTHLGHERPALPQPHKLGSAQPWHNCLDALSFLMRWGLQTHLCHSSYPCMYRRPPPCGYILPGTDSSEVSPVMAWYNFHGPGLVQWSVITISNSITIWMADAFDQMVWKSCLHGLLQETCMVVCGMKQYYLKTSENKGEALCASREAKTSMIWSHEGIEKRTMSDHGPEMSTAPLETQSPITLSKMKQPRRILVTDMYNGYGEFTLLKGYEYVTLASLEIDSFLKNVTPASFECALFLKPWVQEATRALREAKMSTIWRHEGVENCTMSDHGPVMRTVPLETQLLKTFSKMKQSRRILVTDKYNGYGTSTLLKGCEYETLAPLEIDSFLKSKTPASPEYVPFLKPWVQECLTSKLRTLLGADFDTLEKMHSSEAFDLVSGDVNKRDYKDYVEMLIARGLLDKNAMTAAYNKLYCGFLSALFESSFLEEKDPMTRSNTCKDRFQSTVLTPDVFFHVPASPDPATCTTPQKYGGDNQSSSPMKNSWASRTTLRWTTTWQSTWRRSTERPSAWDTTETWKQLSCWKKLRDEQWSRETWLTSYTKVKR